MQSELKPCPFCGGVDIKREDDGYEEWLKCGHCSAAGPYTAEDAEQGIGLVAAWNRRVTLSDQERAVEVKGLEWRQGYRDAGCSIVQASTFPFYQIRQLDDVIWLDIDNHQAIYPSVDAAQAAAHADYEQRIRSALVDVPVEPVASVPVGWVLVPINPSGEMVAAGGSWSALPGQTWADMIDAAPIGPTPPHHKSTEKPVALIEREALAELQKHKTATGTVCSPQFKSKFGDKVPLYTHPPHREGEDSAEVIEEGAKILAKWIGYAWDGLSDRDISAECKDWAYNGIGALGMQGGKPALRKVAASVLALAATRSGSATGQKGCEP